MTRVVGKRKQFVLLVVFIDYFIYFLNFLLISINTSNLGTGKNLNNFCIN